MAKIISVSGAHGTGKSEFVLHLAQYYMRKYPDKRVGVLHEIAGECRFPINLAASRDTQTWLFARQLEKEIELMGKYDLVVSDRSVVDVIAYTEALGFEDLARAMMRMSAGHVKHYQHISFRSIANNDFWFDNGLRETTDKDFRAEVERRMLEMYGELGEAAGFEFCQM